MSENMYDFKFLKLSVMYEDVEIITINAGCEDDAFDLSEDYQDNMSSIFLLTPKMLRKLKKVVENENKKVD